MARDPYLDTTFREVFQEPVGDAVDYSTETRQKMAKDGAAMSDGSYPIRTKQDVANAILAIGRSDASKRPAVKAHIKKRAAALGCTDMIPQHWS